MDLQALLNQYAPNLAQSPQSQIASEVEEFTQKEQEWLDRQADEYIQGIETAKLNRLYWLSVGSGMSATLIAITCVNLLAVPYGIGLGVVLNIGTVLLSSHKRWVGLALSAFSIATISGYSFHYNQLNRIAEYEAKTALSPIVDEKTSFESLALGVVLVFGILCVLPREKKRGHF